MAEGSKYQEVAGLWVHVDRVSYVPASDNPAHRPHRFAYYITIHNDSPRIITILGRKWIVTNHQGMKLMIEGDGVMGQFPRLSSGDQYHYNNYHLIDTSSTAEGAYHGQDEEGQKIIVRIPSFKMTIPDPSPAPDS
ncbi:MAG: ApaG domain [Blastochloris sp.]|nr:ApaG domain [Blastochloris sp.]